MQTVQKKPTQIYLIPTTLAADTHHQVLCPQVLKVLMEVNHYLVENLRSARRFVASLKLRPVDELHFELFNKHTNSQEIAELLSPLKNGQSVGVLSEAGCPAIADPGSRIVNWAHHHKIKVVPLVGPSSILMALMASGMNGQSFEFHGYLPVEPNARNKKIKSLEKESQKTGKTQIFMETPYRNMVLAQALLKCCHDQTKVCFATNLTAPDEHILTRSVQSWRKELFDLHKKPTMFLLQG